MDFGIKTIGFKELSACEVQNRWSWGSGVVESSGVRFNPATKEHRNLQNSCSFL